MGIWIFILISLLVIYFCSFIYFIYHLRHFGECDDNDYFNLFFIFTGTSIIIFIFALGLIAYLIPCKSINAEDYMEVKNAWNNGERGVYIESKVNEINEAIIYNREGIKNIFAEEFYSRETAEMELIK